MKKKKLCFIFGTRPEIIKLSPLIKMCENENIPYFCIHTGQHYSYKLDRIFFKELNIPLPNYQFKIRSKATFRQGDHTGRMLIKIEEVLLHELPYCVLIQGDTNSALAGLLTAEKISTTKAYTGLEIKRAHVEAGLRCYDRSLPEEVNRIIADHFSNWNFAPTALSKQNMIKEGIPASRIFITGNTIVDVIREVRSSLRGQWPMKKNLGIEQGAYILLTLHRQENVNSKQILNNIFKGLLKVSKELKLPIIFPMHPRTQKVLSDFKIRVPDTLEKIEPLGYLDFLLLQSHAAVVLTDSGGLQEEACALHVPCVTLRENTERPETVKVGANIIAGHDPEKILKATLKMVKSSRKWKNPYGNGMSAKKIIDIIMREK